MERTWMPRTAGILNIVSGAFVLIGGITTATILGTPMAISVSRYYMYSVGSSDGITPSVITMVISILAAVLIIAGIVSLLGGIYALKRRIWGLALAGSIFTFFPLPPLGIPAIIFTALSKNKFE